MTPRRKSRSSGQGRSKAPCGISTQRVSSTRWQRGPSRARRRGSRRRNSMSRTCRSFGAIGKHTPARGGSFAGDRGRQAGGFARPRPRHRARTFAAIAGGGKAEGRGEGGKDATAGDHASASGDASAWGTSVQCAAARAGRSKCRGALLMSLPHRQFLGFAAASCR